MSETGSMAKRPPRSKRRLWCLRLLAVFCAFFVAFLLAEFVVRVLGSEDADGNFTFRGSHIGAVHPPVEWVREKINEYRESDTTRMIFNPQTGWSPRPNSSSHNGMYRYNSLGIRSAPAEYTVKPIQGVLRIALFGDSFTHGDDVPFEETWGYFLEQNLNKLGVRAEVINFGVSAYGMDQAFLRWRRIGKQFSPHIVLFGFQAENVSRNVNLLRGFMSLNTGIPFSKPRFILNEKGRLEPVNVPTLPLETVPDVMADMENWKYAKHEWFYNPKNYDRRFWHHSRFVSLIVAQSKNWQKAPLIGHRPVFPPDGEPALVTRKILAEFEEEVVKNGGRFLVVHLPKKSDIDRSDHGKPLQYEKLLAQIEGEQKVIDPFNSLFDDAHESSLDGLFAKGKRHYSARGNKIIAHEITDYFQKNQKTVGLSFK